jgi:hypothetical protein
MDTLAMTPKIADRISSPVRRTARLAEATSMQGHRPEILDTYADLIVIFSN